MKEVKISVIIPVYNTEKFLERCLNSVLNQTLRDIEIIVVNDGSRDNSLEIIKKFKENDNRIVLLDEQNGGSSFARNKGLEVSKGKYFYFIDSDDYLEENTMFEEVYNKCEKDNLDMVVFDYYNDFGNRKECVKNIEVSDGILINKEDYIKDLIKNRCGISIWGKLVKKDIFIENNIKFPENIFMGEDLLTSLKLVFFSKKIGKLNKAFYNYVQHENQGTKILKKEKAYEDLFYLYMEIESFLKKQNIFFNYKDVFYSRIFQMCRSILKNKYKNVKIYNRLKKYLLENKKEIFNSSEYKRQKLIKKLRFHLKNKIFYIKCII